MTASTLFIIYLVGIIPAAVVGSWEFPPQTHEDRMITGAGALLWPPALLVLLMAGIVIALGWIGQAIADLVDR